MPATRWRWMLVCGVAAVGLGWAVVARFQSGDDAGLEPARVESFGILCVRAQSTPAEASSDGRQRYTGPVIAQDPRCDDVRHPVGFGGVALVTHNEPDDEVGNFAVVATLRFDEDGRCFYAEVDGDPIGIVWPDQFMGMSDRARILDDDGSTVASAGDDIRTHGRWVSNLGLGCGSVQAESDGFMATTNVEVLSPG